MKKLDKMRMVRWADAFLPAAFLIASAFGRSYVAENIFLTTLFTRLFALASARGLRQAFSEQPSLRGVRGSVKTALLLQIPGALALILADLLRDDIVIPSHLAYISTAFLLNIEHVFYEYLYATGDGQSATRCRAITAALMAGGLMMTSLNSNAGLLPYSLEWPLGAAGLSTAVAIIIAAAIGGPLNGKLNPQVLKSAPLSIIQSLVYTLLWLGLCLIPRSPLGEVFTSVPFFAGLTVYELCRAPFRRSSMESRVMNRTLLVIAAIALVIVGAYFIPAIQTALRGVMGGYCIDIPAAAISVIAACAAGFGLYGSF